MGLVLGLALAAAGGPLQAQDAFPGAAPARPATRPAPSPVPADTAPRGPVGEAQDFGVEPTAQLRPSDRLHAPTPTTIPGGRVVGTQQLAQWLKGSPERVLLLHAVASREHLPHAQPAAPAAQGGSFEDQVQRDFGAYLQQATGGDRSRTVVTYCQGVQCWGSYNAALRAIRLGYTNVHWYRGGLEAWKRAGLAVETAAR